MNDSPEELEAQKARAFLPPVVRPWDDIKYLVNFLIISVVISFSFYFVLSGIYLLILGLDFTALRTFLLYTSFAGTIVFGILRTLRFSMAQTASDAYMIFPMSTQNVRGHLRELVNLATAVEWDLTGLVGSFAVLLLIFFVV